MSNYFETIIRPVDYLTAGNFRIVKAPYLDTSLHELAVHGFKLWFECKYMPTQKASKIRMRFVPPNGGGPSINFEFFSSKVVGSDNAVIEYLRAWNGTFATGPVPKNVTQKGLSFREIDPSTFEETYRVKLDESVVHDIVSLVGDDVGASIRQLVIEGIDRRIPGTSEWKQRNIASEIVLPEVGTTTLGMDEDTILFQTETYAQSMRLDDPETEVALMRYFNDRRAEGIKLPKAINIGGKDIDLDAITSPTYDNVIDITDLLKRLGSFDEVAYEEKVAINAK